MDSNGSPVSPRRSSWANTSPMRAFAPRRRPCQSSSTSARMRASMRAPPASSTTCSTCRSARRTRMSSGRSIHAPSAITARQPDTPRLTSARPPHSSHSVASWPCASMRASAMAWMSFVFAVMSCSRREGTAPGRLGVSLRAPTGAPSVGSTRLPMTGRGQRPWRAVRRGRAGPGGLGPGETGVDRTPPPPGHAPAGAPMGSTSAAERRTETKRCAAALHERSARVHQERHRRQEPHSVRWRWNRGVSGMLTAPVRRRGAVT